MERRKKKREKNKGKDERRQRKKKGLNRLKFSTVRRFSPFEIYNTNVSANYKPTKIDTW